MTKRDTQAADYADEDQRVKEFNINDYVWVRLKQRGIEEIAADPLDVAAHAHRKERDGWTRWQLWDLMVTLGHLCTMGTDPPFETTIRLESGERKE